MISVYEIKEGIRKFLGSTLSENSSSRFLGMHEENCKGNSYVNLPIKDVGKISNA